MLPLVTRMAGDEAGPAASTEDDPEGNEDTVAAALAGSSVCSVVAVPSSNPF